VCNLRETSRKTEIMSDLNTNIENILKELSIEILDGKKIELILNNPEEYPSEIIEKLSIETALKYWNGEIDYEDGDCIMNNIYSYWVTNEYYYKNYEFSKIAWKCFEAFDAGEYTREEDEPNIDPVEKYTKPQIEKFLKDRKLI
jgi:hypothetical protein